MQQATQQKEEIILNKQNSIGWNDLIFELKIEEVMILKMLYSPQPKSLTFKEIERKLKKLSYCSKTIRSKVRKLEHEGLLETVNSYGLFVFPIDGIQNQIYELIIKCNQRFSI